MTYVMPSITAVSYTHLKGHPFKVKDDEAMMETADSIKQYGVLVPAIARPDPEGGYEPVSYTHLDVYKRQFRAYVRTGGLAMIFLRLRRVRMYVLLFLKRRYAKL